MWHYSFSCILPLYCGSRLFQLVPEVFSGSEKISGCWGDVIVRLRLQIKPQGRQKPHNAGGQGGFSALGEPNCHFCRPRPQLCHPNAFLASFEKRGAKLRRLGHKVYIRSFLFPKSPSFVVSTSHLKSDLAPLVTSTLHLQLYIHTIIQWVATIHDACASIHVSHMYTPVQHTETNA